jgi:hypothetical protein
VARIGGVPQPGERGGTAVKSDQPHAARIHSGTKMPADLCKPARASAGEKKAADNR